MPAVLLMPPFLPALRSKFRNTLGKTAQGVFLVAIAAPLRYNTKYMRFPCLFQKPAVK